jgi:hypothetical protein
MFGKNREALARMRKNEVNAAARRLRMAQDRGKAEAIEKAAGELERAKRFQREAEERE